MIATLLLSTGRHNIPNDQSKLHVRCAYIESLIETRGVKGITTKIPVIKSNWDDDEADELIWKAKSLSIGSSALEAGVIELAKSLEEYQRWQVTLDKLPPSGMGCRNELPANNEEMEITGSQCFGAPVCRGMWSHKNQLAEKDEIEAKQQEF